MASYRVIPLETYPRKAHFIYFQSMSNPYMGLTVSVDITNFIHTVQEEKTPFFLSFLYCVSRAANRVPQLRQRVCKGKIIEYDHCPTSHTVGLPDETYCYCFLESQLSFPEFLPYALQEQEKAKLAISLEDGEENASLPLLFISSLPWVSYDALLQPTPIPADTNPRITWGRWRREGKKYLLPVTVLCNHALVDGLHLARFYEYLNQELAAFPQKTRLH